MWEGKGIGKMIKGQKGNYGKIVKREILFHADIDDRNIISQSVKSISFFQLLT